MSYYIGLDLGQMQDYTALTVLEQTREADGTASYDCRHLERLQLGTAYPAIVGRVKDLMGSPELQSATTLVVDATGVGVAVTDMLRDAGLFFDSVTITGGEVVTEDKSRSSRPMYRVPKRDLVGVVQVLLQTKRIRFAAGMEHVDTLVGELLNFRVKIDPTTAHDTYGAGWREGKHDDLVLALALAAWRAEYRVPGPGIGPSRGVKMQRPESAFGIADWAVVQDEEMLRRGKRRL